MKKFILLLALPLLGAEYSATSNWLIDLNATSAQMEAIQKQFRGFDTAMLEVGHRYEATKKAIHQGNYPLAAYHWEKIKTAIDYGVMRRPTRKMASEVFFLNGIYPEVRNALVSGDSKQIHRTFESVRHTCNGCHADQKVGFIVVE